MFFNKQANLIEPADVKNDHDFCPSKKFLVKIGNYQLFGCFSRFSTNLNSLKTRQIIFV